MRRRMILALLALLAAGGAVRLRARRRAARRLAAAAQAAQSVGAPASTLPAPPAQLPAPSTAPPDPPGAAAKPKQTDDVVIADAIVDHDLASDPQVDPESPVVMEPRPPVEPPAPASAAARGRFLSIPWSPHPDPPPAGTTELRLHCTLTAEGMELARVDVRETASQVFVTVLARWAPASPGDQRAGGASTGRKREATATLREPLGDRTLVHAPHDAPPPAAPPRPQAAPHDAPPPAAPPRQQPAPHDDPPH